MPQNSKMLVPGPVQNQANKFGTSNSCSWRPRKPSWKRRNVCQDLGSRKANRLAGLSAAAALLHLLLLTLPGNPGGAPFERKRRANQEVRGEPLQQRGRRAHFPFLRALGTVSRWDRGTAGASHSEEPAGLHTQWPPQVHGDHQLSASAAREEWGSSGCGLQVSMG